MGSTETKVFLSFKTAGYKWYTLQLELLITVYVTYVLINQVINSEMQMKIIQFKEYFHCVKQQHLLK